MVAAAVNDCTVLSARQSLHFSHPKQGERREREIERQHLEKASETQFGKLRDVFPHSPALQPLEPGTTPKTVSLGLPGTTVTQRSILSPVPTLVCCHCNPLSLPPLVPVPWASRNSIKRSPGTVPARGVAAYVQIFMLEDVLHVCPLLSLLLPPPTPLSLGLQVMQSL